MFIICWPLYRQSILSPFSLYLLWPWNKTFLYIYIIYISLPSSQFDDFRTDYTGAFTTDDIDEFAVGCQLPYVVEFSDTNAPKIFGGPVKTHVLLFAPKVEKKYEEERRAWFCPCQCLLASPSSYLSPHPCCTPLSHTQFSFILSFLLHQSDANINTYLEAMKGAAKANQGKLLFIHLDTSHPENQRYICFWLTTVLHLPCRIRLPLCLCLCPPFSIVEFFGIGANELPTIRLINIGEEMSKYKPTSSEISEATLKQFAADYLAGKLKVCSRMHMRMWIFVY